MPTSMAAMAPSTRNSTDLKNRDFTAASLFITGIQSTPFCDGMPFLLAAVGLNDRRYGVLRMLRGGIAPVTELPTHPVEYSVS